MIADSSTKMADTGDEDKGTSTEMNGMKRQLPANNGWLAWFRWLCVQGGAAWRNVRCWGMFRLLLRPFDIDIGS